MHAWLFLEQDANALVGLTQGFAWFAVGFMSRVVFERIRRDGR
jgi:hypothetical protein